MKKSEWSQIVEDMFAEQAVRDVGAFIEVQRKKKDGSATFIGISDFITTGKEIITAPNPNNYGREIVLEERLPSYSGPVQFVPLGKKACPYCGNTSGLKDSRGMCVSCGGDLGSDSGNKREFPKPIIDWKI